MPAPLDPEKRALIEQDIRDGLKRNEIARRHGVGAGTVTNIGKKLEAQGAGPAFDRSGTKRATEARSADAASRRLELASLLLDDAFRMREMAFDGAFPVVVGGVRNPRVIMVPPNTTDLKNLFISLGIAIDKVAVLVADEAPEQQAGSLLEALVTDIRSRRPMVAVPDATG